MIFSPILVFRGGEKDEDSEKDRKKMKCGGTRPLWWIGGRTFAKGRTRD
jgi:hypothetical protein